MNKNSGRDVIAHPIFVYLSILQQQSCCIMAKRCKCSKKSKCKTTRCKCLTSLTHCGSACGCGPACTNRPDYVGQQYSLRESVSGLTNITWSYRGDVDAYTKRSREDLEGVSMENDHVWEIQILEAVQRFLPPAYNTRAVADNLKVIANNVSNLNVTTHKINQAKKGPFTIWRNRYTRRRPITLDKAIGLTSSRYGKTTMKKEGIWSNIKKEVVKTTIK